ncbi:hypothetical protein crov417 [Cafeteria roenbergensis virus]|uniref:SET domain-containing protein n=1 Tax=Cafeteria roenbergensis virus (strain BV-PW1) TaxID=693272 RepID=E3T5I8_CROVB|nr:hypothetical protein crov417 [Cafeteria roenbergensis virus BV-PW1]ADO67451.1 hypothetical protein crov417 [Cafeteria roenbergensis virus BV-PW1]
MEIVIIGGLILSTILYGKNTLKKPNQTGGNKINETLYKVAPSPLEGVGLFALGDIKEGTHILEDRIKPTGNFYNTEELKHLNQNFVRTMQDYWCLSSDGKTFIPNNPHILSPVNFINHSDNPNVKHMGNYFLVIKNIKEGEEILENYNQVCKGAHIMLPPK